MPKNKLKIYLIIPLILISLFLLLINFNDKNIGTSSPTRYVKFNADDSIRGVVYPYGDGSDGDVVISSTTTLTRNMFYNNLTINTSTSLLPSGFIIYVKGTLTVNGKISFNGNNGSSASSSANATTITNTPGTSGGAGGTSTPTTTNSIFTNIAGLNGGDGQTGGANCSNNTTAISAIPYFGFYSMNGVNGSTGGDEASRGSVNIVTIPGNGANTTIVKHLGTIQDIQRPFRNDGYYLAAQAGNGASSGGLGYCHDSLSVQGSGAGGAGGGGASGGIIFIIARNILVNAGGSIEANGGNGGNGGNSGNVSGSFTGSRICCSGGGGAGGVGGNGGYILLAYNSITNLGSITVNKGNPGNGGTAGLASCSGISNAQGGNGANGTTANDGYIRYYNLY
jgi:hypothetical protein